MRIEPCYPFLVVGAFLSAACAAQETGQTPAEKRAVMEARFRSLEYGKALLKEPHGDQAFIPLGFEELPRELKSQMYNRLSHFIQTKVHPQDIGRWLAPGRMTIRVLAAQNKEEHDLVEYRWVHMGQDLRVVASRNAARLDIDLDELLRNADLVQFGWTEVRRARGLIENTLRIQGESVYQDPFEIRIAWPDSLADGIRFPSNPEWGIPQVRSSHWFERVDFFVQGRTLSMITYHKPDMLLFPQGGSNWFSDDFRAKVHERARELGKLPEKAEQESE